MNGCNYASSGCNYPEGECAGLCASVSSKQAEPVAHAVIAGVLFDFMGWLTSRDERIILSSVDDASPAVDVIQKFAEMRGLNLDEVRVKDWQQYASETHTAPAVSQEPFGYVYKTLGETRFSTELNTPGMHQTDSVAVYTHPVPAVAQKPVAFGVMCEYCGGSGLDREDSNYGCPPCNSTGFVEKMLYTEAPTVAQPPAEVVRELMEALQKAEDAITFELGGEPCGLQTALIAVRAALAKAKEHGL